MKIVAVIAVYNPDIKLLRESISSYLQAVDKVLVVNNSDNCIDLNSLVELSDKIVIINLNDNLGIAEALNIGIEESLKHECDFIMTMDQDTVFCPHLVKIPMENFTENIMAIVPAPPQDHQDGPYLVKRAIQSGAIFCTNIFKTIGKFNSNYFIDYVDYDFFMRGREHGYKILAVPEIMVSHKNGDMYEGKFICWRYKYRFSSPLRMYYQTRNALDYILRYKDFKQLLVLLKLFAKVTFVSNYKIERFKYIKQGIIDWYNNKWGKYNG